MPNRRFKRSAYDKHNDAPRQNYDAKRAIKREKFEIFEVTTDAPERRVEEAPG